MAARSKLLLLVAAFGAAAAAVGSTSSSSSRPLRLGSANQSANLFGMGVYNDTDLGTDVQLPETRALVGEGGFALLFVNLLFTRTGDPASCEGGCLPPAWFVSAVEQAYALGLTPVVRLGQWSRQIRNFSDDTGHRRYTALAAAYRRFLDGVPRPPGGASDLLVVLLNEPNVCSEWQCGDGAGAFLNSSTIAAEAASCLRDLAAAVRTLPRMRVALAPIAYAAPTKCECAQPGHNPPVNFSVPNDAAFIAAMRAEVPDLWDAADYFTAHPYAFGNVPFSEPGGRAGVENYRAELQAVGRPDLPVAVTETGWKGTDEEVKAASMVAAYREVFLPDPSVFAVMPFLLGASSAVFADFAWETWAPGGTPSRSLQWNATYRLRCSLGLGGACDNSSFAATSAALPMLL